MGPVRNMVRMVVVFSMATLAVSTTVANRGNEMLSLSGQTFRAIEVAVNELDHHGLKVENYQITVETAATSIFVVFDDVSRAIGQRGSSPRVPGFEVEIRRRHWPLFGQTSPNRRGARALCTRHLGGLQRGAWKVCAHEHRGSKQARWRVREGSQCLL